MRITRETLLNIARDTAAQRTRSDRNILGVYLYGSLLEEEFLLGGTADIDLVFIHMDTAETSREIVPLTDEVHLDIAHHYERDYRQARQLRVNPWLGPAINECQALYDPQHFLDFTQAGVRGQFERPDNVYQRALGLSERARQIWLAFQTHYATDPGPEQVFDYLRALRHAANAVASLSGTPISERRFLLYFQKRAEAIGQAGMYAGLLGLLGSPNVEPETLSEWLHAWQGAYEAVPSDARPPRLHPGRRFYYQKALETLLNGPQPKAVLWPMLRTWTLAVKTLPDASPHRIRWRQAYDQLGLIGAGFDERLRALDAFLDLIDETLETWARQNGVS
jgi:hypothetical protein